MGALSRYGRRLIIAVIVLWSVFPIYWALNTSLMNSDAASSVPAQYVPYPSTFTNYAHILGITSDPANASNNLWPEFSQTLGNSVIECVTATVLTVIIAIFSAYAFARLRFRFKNVIFYTVIATLALPAYATLIPLYHILGNAGLVNTYTGIVLVYVSGFLPLAMWIMHSYFQGIPLVVEEAGHRRLVDPGRAVPHHDPRRHAGHHGDGNHHVPSAWGQFLFPLVLGSDILISGTPIMAAERESAPLARGRRISDFSGNQPKLGGRLKSLALIPARFAIAMTDRGSFQKQNHLAQA